MACRPKTQTNFMFFAYFASKPAGIQKIICFSKMFLNYFVQLFKSTPNNGSKSVLQNKSGNLVKTIPEIACPNLRTCLQKRLPKSLPKFVPKFAPKFKRVILVAKIIYRVLGRVLGKDLGRRFWRHLPKFGRTFFPRFGRPLFSKLLPYFRHPCGKNLWNQDEFLWFAFNYVQSIQKLSS